MAADVDAKMFASAHHWRITESKSRACLIPTTDGQLDGGRDQRLRYRLMSDRCRNQRDIRRAMSYTAAGEDPDIYVVSKPGPMLYVVANLAESQ